MSGEIKTDVRKYVEMGNGTSRVFSGEAMGCRAIEQAYGESPDFFANQISRFLDPGEENTILDVGAHKGELWQEIYRRLQMPPGTSVNYFALDVLEKALQENHAQGSRLCSSAAALPFRNKSVKVAFMRYVAQFNSLEAQKKIWWEIARVVESGALVEHVGAPNGSEEEWRRTVQALFADENLPELKRPGALYSSWREIEGAIKQHQILDYELVDELEIEGISDVWIHRYGLSEQKAGYLREKLRGKEVFYRTRFILYPLRGVYIPY